MPSLNAEERVIRWAMGVSSVTKKSHVSDPHKMQKKETEHRRHKASRGLLPRSSVTPSITNCSFDRIVSQPLHVSLSLGLLQTFLRPSCGRRPFWSLRRMRRRRDSWSIELAVQAAIPIEFELPGREATEVNVMALNARRPAVAYELNLELHLISLDRFATYRAGLTDAGSARRAVRSARWQLSGANRRSSSVAKNGFVGHCPFPQPGRTVSRFPIAHQRNYRKLRIFVQWDGGWLTAREDIEPVEAARAVQCAARLSAFQNSKHLTWN
jgi:hypothetical protein